jgi:ferritin-like metal-binding protein YciE
MALEDVLIDELRDIYSAENQLVKALPKLARGAKHADLKQLFKDHLEETKGHVLRLREAFEHIGKKPTGKHCGGMEGVIGEGAEALEEDLDDASFDSGLIGAALRTEHYEIAGYNAALAMAKTLGMREVVDLLKQNLEEEIDAARKISAAAKPIFKEATQEEEEDKDYQPASKKKAKDKTSERKSKEDERKAARDVSKGSAARKRPLAAKKEEELEQLSLERSDDEEV